MASSKNQPLDTYKKRKIDLESLFNQTVKIMQEHLKRHERRMFAGLAAKASEPNKEAFYDPDLAKDAGNLARIISKLVELQIKLTNMERKEEKNLTDEQQFQLAVEYVKSLAPDLRVKFLEEVE